MTGQILILEDMPETQEWLTAASLIAFPDAEIFVAGTIAAAASLAEKVTPMLALLDLGLPDGRGNSLIPMLLSRHPACVCIIVTIYADENHLLPSLRDGAKGYILKDQSRERIAEMLTQAMAGELPLSPAVASLVLNQFSDSADIETPVPNEDPPLTKREIEVLTLVASGASAPEVARLLEISKYTVEDHLKHIYRKLDVSTRAEAALAAARLKLV